MASLTYDSGSKTFNADIAIVQTDSDSSLSKDQNIILSNLEVESKLGEEEFNDKNVVPDSRLICDFYQDSISEEPNEIKSSFKDKTTKRHQDKTDTRVNIKLNLIKNNSQPIRTNFYLHKGQNVLTSHKCELIPNVSFDVNRIYTEPGLDDNTYITVDVYKKTIKKTDSKMSQSEKAIGQLRLKLEPHMKEKTSTSLDHHDSLITFTAFRKRLN